jgi:dipeptidyl aminopeptidase/acylaminoacyl peptidase
MTRYRILRAAAIVGALACLAAPFILRAQVQEPYKVPPAEVVKMLDAPPPPYVVVNPSSSRLLLADYEPMPTIADLSRPLLRLAGIRITPFNNSRQVLRFVTGLTVQSIGDGSAVKVVLPEGSRLGFPRWSADGRSIAFARYADTGVELWTADAATGRARALTAPSVNAVLGSGFAWMPDQTRLLVFLVPEGRGPAPEAPTAPIGPDVQETHGRTAKAATYEDLLKTAHDAALFEYYAASQPAILDIATGETRLLGGPGLYYGASVSPDGRFVLVSRLKKPFSYSLPFYGFPRSVEVWDMSGRVVKVLADLPSREGVPLHGVPTGPRDVAWQPLEPASLAWLEALDGGDPEKDAPYRDRLVALAAPFTASPVEVTKTEHRAGMIEWLGKPGRAFLTESDWKRRWETTWLVHVDDPGFAPRKLFSRDENDEYNNPGSLVTTVTPSGDEVAAQDGNRVYLAGRGSTPAGDRPFLDELDLGSLKSRRLFRSAETRYDRFLDFAGRDRRRIIVSAESQTEPPNVFLQDLRSGKRTALTHFQDPTPQMTGMRKELIKYKRADGVDLSGTLYLPPDYKQGQRLPLVIWAYPLEYSDAATAGQVRGSANRFTYFRGTSQLFFVTQGYAVLDNATMPVVGDPRIMNDTFVQQIVSSAKAAIDTLDAMAIADPKRVGVGGHSYGAFMTANLLAHSDLFAAGIARSGAYNRTLTPFGFQSERRTLWEAPQTYFQVSPFMFADKIKTPILLIHGEADNNSGTFPIQSERLFAALKGLGGTARLVMLPRESHGYSARESVLDVLAEMFEWFDTYVKDRK